MASEEWLDRDDKGDGENRRFDKHARRVAHAEKAVRPPIEHEVTGYMVNSIRQQPAILDSGMAPSKPETALGKVVPARTNQNTTPPHAATP
jgi:hypothetical protein